MPNDELTWTKIGEALRSLVLNKSEDKSEAFLIAKRIENGWVMWNELNRRYTATSGMATMERTKLLMSPKEAKSEAEVVPEVEKWMAEQRELIAVGEEEMPWAHKLTALRCIAPAKLRDRMDDADTKLDPMD